MPQTFRVYWGPTTGRQQINFNSPAFVDGAVVIVTACEYTQGPLNIGDQNRFIGAANVTVSNVAPHGPQFGADNGVTFVVNVERPAADGGGDWPDPIRIVTDITVLDPPPPGNVQNATG